MASRYNSLPLRWLVVFEAAGRHGSFTAAAGELGMTQSGVSQCINQLEAELGAALFARRPRGVEPTAAGAALLATVDDGLKLLSNGVATARRQSEARTIRILTDHGLAAWLMDRLPAIGALLPGVEVQLATTRTELGETSAEFDLAIMFGEGAWAGFRSTPFHREQVYPVCAPTYLAGRAAPLDPQDIAAMRLLHLRDDRQGRWLSWDDWFTAYELAPGAGQAGPTFDNAQLLLQATLLGEGVSIGWVPLIDDPVSNGSLVKLAAVPLRSARGYHLVEHCDRPRTARIERLREWLLSGRPPTSAARPALPVSLPLVQEL